MTRHLVASLTAVLALAACASNGDRAVDRAGVGTTTVATATSSVPPAEEAPSLPVELTDGTGTDVTITSVDRIIIVDGDLAEIVFALGLGDRVVATDLSATYPAEADALPQIGYQRALVAEPIATFEPTVVLATDLARPVEALSQLRTLGIPVVVINREKTIDGPAAKVRAVARALGVSGRGEALVAAMQDDIDRALVAGRQQSAHPRVLVLYVRGEQAQLIFGKGSGVDVLLPAVGATDVASELGIGESAQITAEALLQAAPDVLIVTTTGLASVGGIDGLLRLPGVDRTPAGQNRRVLDYEDQYLLGFGPRIGQLMRQLVDDLHRDS